MAEHGVVDGKTFLITGAASGLGAGYAELFLKDGAKKVAIVDIDEEKGKALAEKLNQSYSGKVIFVRCDVSSEESIVAAFNEVAQVFGTIDVVINNAGILNDSPEAWRKQCEVNYAGLVSFTLKSLKHMSFREGGKGGTIINISSTLALIKSTFLPIYGGTKAAVLYFSQSIAADPIYEQSGIRILTICFGATATSLLDNLSTKGYDEHGNGTLQSIESNTEYQKPESAIKGVVEMFKCGSNGSIWLATHDRPLEEITSNCNNFFESFNGKV